MYLCDLVSFTSTGKNISKNIPILNMNNEKNIEIIKTIRTIIKNSYEVKIITFEKRRKRIK